MLENLSRYWWVVALRGLFAVAFGAIALFNPDTTLSVLVLLFGAYALCDGIFALVGAVAGRSAARGRRGWLMVEGIVGIVTGVITFGWPNITTSVLVSLIAIWTVVTGLLEIASAVRLRSEIANEWLLWLSGVISVVFGIYLIVSPQQGALAVVSLIGFYAIAFGATQFGLALRLRQHGQRLSTTTDRGQTVPA
jgi:uncharacterized membrane protein HdeD (DUF308 family)